MDLPDSCTIIDQSPALYHDVIDAIIIADLHIGIEAVKARQGVLIPNVQTKEIGEEIEALQEQTDASRLIVAGDIKHSFGAKGTKQNEDLRRFFDGVSPLFETVVLVEGNHDTGLTVFTEDYTNITVQSSFEEAGTMIVHGHESVETDQASLLILGHEHPALELKDDAGVTEKMRCMLFGSFDTAIIVLPAFSPLASGTAINGMPRSELLSPLLRNQYDPQAMYATVIDREAGVFEFPKLTDIEQVQ